MALPTPEACSGTRLQRPLRIVVDCGNAVPSLIAPHLFRSLGCSVDTLFCDMDGNFPNHHPDPTVPANLDCLIARVRATGADAGVAFDGDGDRVVMVTNKGSIIDTDRLLMLLALPVATLPARFGARGVQAGVASTLLIMVGAALVAADVLGPGMRAKGVAFVLTGLTVANVVGVPLGTFLGQADPANWPASHPTTRGASGACPGPPPSAPTANATCNRSLTRQVTTISRQSGWLSSRSAYRSTSGCGK